MMKAKIKLWDDDRSWKMADAMAINLSHSDEWGLEMTITADYAQPAPRIIKGEKHD